MFDSSIDAAALAVDETAAVRAVIAGAHQAWARGDGRSYAACFTPETADTAFFGVCRDGRAANAELHGALFHFAIVALRQIDGAHASAAQHLHQTVRPAAASRA